MAKKPENNPVKVWEEKREIPTYEVGEPEKYPMFFEKRVYQGSSGKVYPYPIIDKINDERKAKKHDVIFIENEYIKLMLMPTIGGRIQSALDKTNNYDFIYHNHVIKPALVGLLGPWISGGIEFNWPQHHRPSTFDPVEYRIEQHDDGSKTVWMGEIERMSRLREIHGIRLYPGKAYIEINVKVFNRTPFPSTFLWWANPAVHVNDDYQSVFPPDVHSIADHGKRDISTFPIATGTYYKIDYSTGVDISRYKNIPVPASMMATSSKYNFVGGYDNLKEAGLLHVADHHVSPGKKMWTWGNGEFGQAWERNLTDNDGPYIEIMTGVYTDNQPDFAWLAPYEMKTFKQIFMPYKKIGVAKNATKEAVINLQVENSKAILGVYVTSQLDNMTVQLENKDDILLKKIINLSPIKTLQEEVELDAITQLENLNLKIINSAGEQIISYSPEPKVEDEIPEPASAAQPPEKIKTNEELYLTGLHLEQYRHATYDPDPYYLEALRRDRYDVRVNNAYGLLLLRRGQFADSEKHFRLAIKRLTERNPNPYDGESYYNLGQALMMQGKITESYDAFYKSTWNGAFQASGYLALAKTACLKKDYQSAIQFVNRSLESDAQNLSAYNLKCAILRKQGNYTQSVYCAEETLKIDIMNFTAVNELFLNHKALGESEKSSSSLAVLNRLMRNEVQNYLELSIDYASAGFYDTAIQVLERIVPQNKTEYVYPMVYYYLAYYNNCVGKKAEALDYFNHAENMTSDYCFPHRLESILIFELSIKINPGGAMAYYYYGNLLYDKKRYNYAISCWEKALKLNPNIHIVHRNLAIAYFNKQNEPDKACKYLEKAFELDSGNPRLLLELDSLYRRQNMEPQKRLQFLNKYNDLVEQRDDLYLEIITLFNFLGEFDKSIELLMKRKFKPWEGGEGKVIGQYVFALTQLAKKELQHNNYEQAIKILEKALIYPENLGEGKLLIAREEEIFYFLGCAYEGLGDSVKSNHYFKLSIANDYEPSLSLYYNDASSDVIFYQGMALKKLAQNSEASEKFQKLIDYAEDNLHKDVKIDYFAVSLPDFLIFDEDLKKKNEVNCRYLMSLGYIGQGLVDKAKEQLERVLQLERSHQGAYIHLQELNPGASILEIYPEKASL